MDEDIERISIADFEADCLRLLDQIVRQRRVIIIIEPGQADRRWRRL